MKKVFFICLFLALRIPTLSAQEFELTKLAEKEGVSFRGISIPTDRVAWISGTNGAIIKTDDGGENWQWLTVDGFEEMDFRSIKAFSKEKAVIVNAGSPAVVLLTTNGGESWERVYSYDHNDVFYDGIDFWDDERGIIFGDPIEGKLQLLITEDGGESWSDQSDQANVKLKKGEAGFAASGTSIRTEEGGLVWIGTGGTQARLLFSFNYGESWNSYKVPIEQGAASQGIFSLAVNGQKQLIAVGGDYEHYKNNNNVIQLSGNGTSWTVPKTRLSGYKSCVEYIDDQVVVATGTSGTDVSIDGGQHWKALSDMAFHVVKASADGKLVLLAGENGKVYRLSF
ncbi:oxidoreductase [Olivibacter sp. SDN3]|uniref:WD40/YVTN/BNR-like repeat-containing protein n=1 Tax=Olivibacter sp. SDN3 TaxID=2764720 RepID=UPI0016512371|nr:YCF48-related protein [Olivibacter sp. SDN3]QNL50046.1 oxidoreductase [Olivibacter sp. SDN3]